MSRTLAVERNLWMGTIDDWLAGDSRRIRFVVEQNGSPRDISGDDLSWGLHSQPYDLASTKLLSDSDTGVQIVTDPQLDPTAGEFEVRIDEGVTSGIYSGLDVLPGRGLFDRVVVDPTDASKQSWVGQVYIESE